MNILITGANSEIGQEIFKKLNDGDNKFILTSRNEEKLKETYQSSNSERVSFIASDLSNSSGQRKLIDFIQNKFSSIDVFIHVAGVYHDNGKAFSGIDFENFSDDQVRENLEVTSIAPALIIKSLSNKLSDNFRFIAITGTFPTAKGWLPYYLGKKSLEALVIGLTDEYPDYNFNAISPGDTLTEAYKKYFPEYATEEICIFPSDIAEHVEFLLSDQGKFLKGQIIEVKK